MTSDDRFSFLLTALLAGTVMLGASQMRKMPAGGVPDPPRIGHAPGAIIAGPDAPEEPEAETRDESARNGDERIRALLASRPWPEFARRIVFHPIQEPAIPTSGLEEGPPYHLVIEPDGSIRWTARGTSGSRSQPPGLPAAGATSALHVAMPDCASDAPDRVATVRALWREASRRFGADAALFADEMPGSMLALPAGFDRAPYVAQQETRRSESRRAATTQPAAPGGVKIKFGSTTIEAAIAMTNAARRDGLMNRTSLRKDEGLLFVYREAEAHSFWMKGCLLSLDIIYLKDDGEVLSVTTMQPPDPNAFDTDLPRCTSPSPCRLVLEVLGGHSQKMGVKAGSRLGLPEGVALLFPKAGS